MHVASAIYTVSNEFTFAENSFLFNLLDLTGRDLTEYLIHSDPDVFLVMNNQLTRGVDTRNQTVKCSIAMASQFTVAEHLNGPGRPFLKTDSTGQPSARSEEIKVFQTWACGESGINRAI